MSSVFKSSIGRHPEDSKPKIKFFSWPPGIDKKNREYARAQSSPNKNCASAEFEGNPTAFINAKGFHALAVSVKAFSVDWAIVSGHDPGRNSQAKLD